MNLEFKHQQFAHCESGTISTLLTNYGLPISEPMAFGLTSTLFFVYFPFVKMNNMPLVAYRKMPKNIIKRISKNLNIKMETRSYSNSNKANEELTKLLNENHIVGLQTSVYFLPYFPNYMRFHFNAHNLIVYKKEEDEYFVSDPVFETAFKCQEEELTKARFAKGIFAPKGFLYYPKEIPSNINFEQIIKKAIKNTISSLLNPFPYTGIKGMRKLAKNINELKNKNHRYIKNYLIHIVRMQEEIGTGGGGFRFLYAAFLQEAKQYNLNQEILELAEELFIKSGNSLREFARLCVKASKDLSDFNPCEISQKLIEASNYEEEAVKVLKKL